MMWLKKLVGFLKGQKHPVNHQNFRVAIVGGSELSRKALTHLLSRDYAVLFDVCNGANFKANLNPNNLPDFVLIDVDKELEDAIETCDWIVQNYFTTKVVAMTINSEREPIDRMLAHGASGYFLKTIDPEEIKTGFREIYRTGNYLQMPLQHLHKTKVSDKEIRAFAKKFGII